MSNEKETTLVLRHKDAQEKFAYFMLAAAGTAIGFAMTQTKVEPPTKAHLVLAVALLCWGGSFYSGLKFVETAGGLTLMNANHLRFMRLKGKTLSDDQVLDALTTFYENVNSSDKTMTKLGASQGRLLLSGAIFYTAWHILRMFCA